MIALIWQVNTQASWKILNFYNCYKYEVKKVKNTNKKLARFNQVSITLQDF